MTENEKAATWLGWKPTDFACWVHADDEKCDDPSCEGRWKKPALDMSDPRNYMKALESFGPEYLWFVAREYTRIVRTAKVFAIPAGYEGPTPRAALAALWDAENGTKNS